MQDVVWQPEMTGSGYGFQLYLDEGFASKLRESAVPEAYRKSFNDFLEDEVLDNYSFRVADPVRFERDTFLATSVHIGENGTWLSTDSLEKLERNKNLQYYSHNVNASVEAYALLELFGEWVDKAEVVLEEGEDAP